MIFRLHNGIYSFAVGYSINPAYLEIERQSPISPGPGTVVGRAAISRQVARIEDAWTDPLYEKKEDAKIGKHRSMIGVPLIREGEPIGVIGLSRSWVDPFSENEIELVKTFADQAVIAIENARLLNELRERTAELERSYGLVRQQASQLERQARELSGLNQELERRVADQVGEIERMGRLRRFLPPQVADLIVASGSDQQLESHRREITALFCDLRGFTGFTESADAEDVMALLREYHAAIGEKIIKYSGTLERYAGDGVMVVFNDPVPVENPALQAVLMALEMREAIGSLTEAWRGWGHDIGFGIGIAHGFATLGTIGFEGRFDYAAIGTVSNVASRLCDEAKPGQILISSRVLTKVDNAVKVEPVGEFALKGIRRPLAAYNWIGRVNTRDFCRCPHSRSVIWCPVKFVRQRRDRPFVRAGRVFERAGIPVGVVQRDPARYGRRRIDEVHERRILMKRDRLGQWRFPPDRILPKPGTIPAGQIGGKTANALG